MALPRQRIHLPPGTWRLGIRNILRGDAQDYDNIEAFERRFAARRGAPYAVATASGRSALWLLLEALTLAPGAEVICSAFGYPVVPYLVQQMGFRLRLVDCELDTLGLDPEALKECINPHTAAVIATHIYGVPCRIREIAALCDTNKVTLIEDCAHVAGASVGGRPVGSFGKAAYYSFETSKCINTLGGGMVTTSDRAIAAHMRNRVNAEPLPGPGWLLRRMLTTTFEAMATHPAFFSLFISPVLRLLRRLRADETAMTSGYYDDDLFVPARPGRYTNYQAGLGLAQLDTVDADLSARRKHAQYLSVAVAGRAWRHQASTPDTVADYMLFAVRLERMRCVAAALLRAGIDTKSAYMRNCGPILSIPETFANAARAEEEVLHLPAYPGLSEDDLDRITTLLCAILDADHGARIASRK